MDNNPRLPYCPFYNKDALDRVYCEGASIKCPDVKAKRDLLDGYCTDQKNHCNCTLYKMLMSYYDRKYEEDDGKVH